MTRAPDLAEPVLGFRAFDVCEDGRLISVTGHGTVWRPGVVTAYCRRPGFSSHPAPAHDCTCGLYAYTELDPRLKQGERCIAAIAAWGNMEVHETGFRAQRACVLALAATPAADLLQRRLIFASAERYGVPAVPLRHLEAEGLRHARPLSRALVREPGADGPRRPVSA
jgi:hypothetical protein